MIASRADRASDGGVVPLLAVVRTHALFDYPLDGESAAGCATETGCEGRGLITAIAADVVQEISECARHDVRVCAFANGRVKPR